MHTEYCEGEAVEALQAKALELLPLEEREAADKEAFCSQFQGHYAEDIAYQKETAGAIGMFD